MTITVRQRVLEISHYIIKNKTTVRATAKVFHTSKSTVHNDIHTRLPQINKRLYGKIQKIMEKNFDEKHLRGGEATKQKYLTVENG